MIFSQIALATLIAPALPEPDASYSHRFQEGWSALRSDRDAERARAAFEACLEKSPDNPISSYYLACVDAVSGEIEGAFAWLERAVGHGWDDAATAAWDADLAPLRDDPRFDALLARMRAALDRRLDARPAPAIELEWPRGWGAELDPTGERLLLRGGDHAWIADARTGEVVAALPAGERRIGPSTFSPDGEVVATSGLDYGLRLWDARSGEPLLDFEGKALWARPIAFDPTGRVLLNWGPIPGNALVTEVQRWDTTTGEHLRTTGGLPGHRCFVDPTGTRAFVRHRSNEATASVELWDLEREVRLADLTGRVLAFDRVHFGPRGRFAVFVRDLGDDLLPVELATGEVLEPLGSEAPRFKSVGVSGRPARVFAGDETGRVRWWDLESGELAGELQAHAGSVHRLVPTRSGARLLSTGADSDELCCWDTATGERIWSVEVGRLQASPQVVEEAGTVLVPTDANGPQVRRLSDGVLLSIPGPPVVDYPKVALGPEGRRAVLFGLGAPARVVDTRTGASVLELPPLEHADCDPSGRALALVDVDGRAAVADGDTGEVLFALDSDGFLRSADYSPDGRRLLGRQRDAGAILWDAGTGARLADIDPEESTSWRTRWSRDGSRIFAFDDRHRVHLFDGADGSPAEGPFAIGRRPSDVALSPDRAHLAVGTADGHCRVLRCADGAPVAELVHGDPFDVPDVRFVRFDRAGERLVTSTGNAAFLRTWDWAAGRELWSIDFKGGSQSVLRAEPDPSGELLLVHGMLPRNSRLVDAGTGATRLDLATTGVMDLATSTDGRTLFGVRNRSMVAIDAASAARRSTWTLFRSGELMRSSRRGWLDAPPRAMRETALLIDGAFAPAEACAAELLDPKRVDAEAAGVDVAPPRSFHLPRIVSDSPRRSRAEAGRSAIAVRAEDPDGLLGFEVELEDELLPRHVVDDATHLNEDGTLGRLELEVELSRGRDSDLYRVRALARSGLASRAVRIELVR